ncbi:HPr family phosphocarrier protein [Sphingomonas mesophila]|uniref:HPr family phosphocarrier protein n=1 Tax=Sphingomonas mesophila TaxID=2303576 RepID=UPI000E57096C|nr:HPr family phosphocarrier protein [Sphingomonas mesophila]
MSACARTLTVANRRGLHARASAKFVNLVHGLGDGVEVAVEKDGNRVTGTSIMGLMMLGAAMGDTITIHCSGADCDSALEQLVALVEGRFGEE